MALGRLQASRSEATLRTAKKAFATPSPPKSAKRTGSLTGSPSFNDPSFKLPGLQQVSWGNKTAWLEPIKTVWDESNKENDANAKRMQTLLKRVDGVEATFDRAAAATSDQRQLMDDLYHDQISMMDGLADDLDSRSLELADQIEIFFKSYRCQLKDTEQELHEQLTDHVSALLPRLGALEARQRVLRALIAEEKDAREKQNAAILEPAATWCEQLRVDLKKETAIQQANAAKIEERMLCALEHLEFMVQPEAEARIHRFADMKTMEAQARGKLEKKDEMIDRVCEEQILKLNEDADYEAEHRKIAQDPLVASITEFMEKFHMDIEEKACMG
eukprot:TRINITY_DN111860_c0_g1_i1.p1 TRINITY_DN111860_c0_g1~~TRINITY_DN111860_c0_g1_i1.p1  ORF type:complete len:356 (-),score=83.53 TRINITY_DN111860_c0_g1_i1:149-1144(-)